MKMRAAILHELSKPLVIEELEVPALAEGQVLVRVKVSGICHTQVLEARGKRGHDPFLPHTLGHEGAGVVEAVGSGVTTVKPGDHVILSWMKGKGLNAKPPLYSCGGKTVNAGMVTTFQEYTIAAENRVVAIRKDMPLDTAALIGCAFATGAGAVFNTAKAAPGMTIAVFGVGGIGLSAVQAGAVAGATVIAVDVQDHKLAAAKEYGAAHAVHGRNEKTVERLLELTGGKGVDVAIEAAGLKQTMEDAFRSIRIGGGLCILIGNLPKGMEISIDPFALICGKRIVGSWGGETDPERDFPRYVDMALAGKLDLGRMITHRYTLDRINDGLEALERGEVGRAIVEM